MLFSKVELLCTYSSQTYYQTTDILKENHIQYESKVVNQQDASPIGCTRGHVGTLGINPQYERLYYIYVNKSDLEKATYLINNAGNQ